MWSQEYGVERNACDIVDGATGSLYDETDVTSNLETVGMARIRQVTFTREERQRIADQCKALGITFEEFVRYGTLQALDEMEGLGRELRSSSTGKGGSLCG